MWRSRVAAIAPARKRRRRPATAPAADRSAPPADHAANVQAFRDKHEADYLRDWVSIAGLHFLEPGTHSVGRGVEERRRARRQLPDTMGRLIVKGNSMRYEPAPGVPVMRRVSR